MSKEELVRIILYKTMHLDDTGDECWTPNEIRYAIVTAYNKAIDDAIKVCYLPTVTGTVLGDLEQLKIKD